MNDSPNNAEGAFDPDAGNLYTLEVTARLANLSDRTVMLYHSEGLVQSAGQTELGGLLFDDRCIRQLRQVVYLQRVEGVNLTGLKIIFALHREVEILREHLRFLRGL